MLDWFKSKFSEIIVNQNSTFQLDCVRDVIINNIPGATKVKWVFDKDQIQTLYINPENYSPDKAFSSKYPDEK
jgi:hypothetical protein